MKASFIKRLGAFVFDTLILSVIFSIITIGFINNNSNINKEINNVLEQYENSEITIEEYTGKVINLNYELQKNNFASNILNVVLYIGYFIVFGYLNKGQTIGKKIMKIRVVNNSQESPSIWNMIVRSLFIYGISTLLFSVMFVNIFDIMTFTFGYLIVTYIEAFLMIIAFFMILYKKDGRGLHDIIARTKVIEEVK